MGFPSFTLKNRISKVSFTMELRDTIFADRIPQGIIIATFDYGTGGRQTIELGLLT